MRCRAASVRTGTGAGRASPSSLVVTSYRLSRQFEWEGHIQVATLRLGCGEVWVSVGYGVSEYTLVFQRGGRKADKADRAWIIVRPFRRHGSARQGQPSAVAEVFAVPICSALALDGAVYEGFLSASGVLDEILALLERTSVRSPGDAEMARKEIQALVMAAEVQHIVERMPA